MSFEPKQFIKMQTKDLPKALKELSAGQKTSHWIWYIFPQLKTFGFSDMAKRFGIENLHDACAYLQNPILFKNYLDAIAIVHEKLNEGISAKTLMGTEIDAQKLKRSVTLFNMALAKLMADENDSKPSYQKLQTHCMEVLDKLGGACSETIAFITAPTTDILASTEKDEPLMAALKLYIKTRGDEWTYHYNFLGLVALFYWLKDVLTCSNDLKVKSKEIKISAAMKVLRKLDSQLTLDEQAALNEGRLSKIMLN